MIQSLRRGFMDVIDFLLPRLCCGCTRRITEPGAVVCRRCLDRIPPLYEPVCVLCGCPDAKITEPGRCAACPPGTVWFQQARATALFDGMAQQIVFRLKYNRRQEYAAVMADAMAGTLGTNREKTPLPDIIVPVPLHRTRFRDRGFNQSETIGKLLAQRLGLDFSRNAISKIRATPSQTRLKKRARRKNVENAFKCPRPDLIAGRRILLVDDVYTTGSTLNECARMLIEAGAESVQCIAYARAVLA